MLRYFALAAALLSTAVVLGNSNASANLSADSIHRFATTELKCIRRNFSENATIKGCDRMVSFADWRKVDLRLENRARSSQGPVILSAANR